MFFFRLFKSMLAQICRCEFNFKKPTMKLVFKVAIPLCILMSLCACQCSHDSQSRAPLRILWAASLSFHHVWTWSCAFVDSYLHTWFFLCL